MWFAVWSVLVLVALAVPVALAAGLWVHVRALGRDFAETAAAVGERLDVEPPDAPRARPTLLDVGTRSRARALRAGNRRRRAARRAETLDRALVRWDRHGLVGGESRVLCKVTT